jgi:hypothetical protein
VLISNWQNLVAFDWICCSVMSGLLFLRMHFVRLLFSSDFNFVVDVILIGKCIPLEAVCLIIYFDTL